MGGHGEDKQSAETKGMAWCDAISAVVITRAKYRVYWGPLITRKGTK